MLSSSSRPHPHAEVSPRSGRLRWPDAFTLFAVATVVLLVSLPRLRGFALRANQGDAGSLVTRLGSLLDSSVQAAELPSVRDVIQNDTRFTKQLGDAEFLDEGRLLRRHGYLFEVVLSDETPGPEVADPASPAPTWRVRAWPWEHGRSGLASFVWLPGRGLARHANAEGQWSGLERAPAPIFSGTTSPDALDWRLLGD